MELDLRFQQYNVGENISKNENEVDTNKPYSDVIDFLEKNISTFNYSDFVKNFSNVNSTAQIYLSDGTLVEIGKINGIINLGLRFPNKTKFIGCWTNIVDDAEFAKNVGSVPHS